MNDVHGYEPTPRWGHTSVTIGDRVYMWGGRTEDFSESSKKVLATVVEVFSLPDQCWKQKKTKGKPPLGLYNNAHTVIDGDLYVYGGWDGHVAHNSLHKLHVDTLTWTEMAGGDVDELPMKMSGCGLVAFGSDKLVLFGGYGMPSTTKSSSKPTGKKTNLVTTTSSKTPPLSTTFSSRQSSVDEEGVKLLAVKSLEDGSKGGVVVNKGALLSDKAGGGSGGDAGLVNGESGTSKGGVVVNEGALLSDKSVSNGDSSLVNGESELGETSKSGVVVNGGALLSDKSGVGCDGNPSLVNGESESGETSKSGVVVNEGASLSDEAGGGSGEGVINGGAGVVNGESESEETREDRVKEGGEEGGGREEERKEEEKNEEEARREEDGKMEELKEGSEVAALIDKRWTNELKVYDLHNGTWSSPEVSGDCPPPCVDFSFNCIDGHVAVLFGGYQPESGTSSGTYLLDMELWHWSKIGDYETTKGRQPWPVGRDGHASCVLSEVPHPQILITGGWDKDNLLLNDGWILDVQRRSWRRFSIPDSVGPRFWHRVVSYKYSSVLRQLLFFGGCPGAPMDAASGGSWEKLASTVLVEIGCVKMPSSREVQRHRHNHRSNSKSAARKAESEWVMVDSFTMKQMGADATLRMKERLLVAEYRAIQAEAHALKAEKIARDTLSKLETALSRLGKGVLPLDSQFTNSALPYTSDSPSVSQSREKVAEKQPFWVIPRNDIKFTAEELGKGRWGVVKVAEYKAERVAARCIYSRFSEEESRKVFMEGMEVAAKLRHPNILPLLGAVLEGEQPIIITELMQSSLRKVLDAGKLYNHQIATIALDIASGLLFLHTTRPDPVVHGDIASTGVLVQKEAGNHWRAKLSDFMTANYFCSMITSSTNDSDRDSFSPGAGGGGVFARSAPRTTPPRTTPPPFPISSRSRILSGSDASVNRRATSRQSIAPDMLDAMTLTLERDVYCFGLILVEICTGTPPVEVSFQFLTESITWTEMSGMVKICTEHQPSSRPSMETVVSKMKFIHRTTTSRPSKFNMTIAS